MVRRAPGHGRYRRFDVMHIHLVVGNRAVREVVVHNRTARSDTGRLQMPRGDFTVFDARPITVVAGGTEIAEDHVFFALPDDVDGSTGSHGGIDRVLDKVGFQATTEASANPRHLGGNFFLGQTGNLGRYAAGVGRGLHGTVDQNRIAADVGIHVDRLHGRVG